MICYHVTPKENLESIMKEGLMPKVGKRSEKLEAVPRIYLFPSIDDMEAALAQWLGEEFEEEYPNEGDVISLKVELPDNWELESDVEFEIASLIPIPKEYISFFREE